MKWFLLTWVDPIKIVTKLEEKCGNQLKWHGGNCPIQMWVGLYKDNKFKPSLVCQVSRVFNLRFNDGVHHPTIPKEVNHIVGNYFRTFIQVIREGGDIGNNDQWVGEVV